MILLERGLFVLNTHVSEFIHAFTHMEASIPDAERIDQVAPCETPTLHQLLTHISGLSYAFNDGILPRPMGENNISFDNGGLPLSEAVDCAAFLPLAFNPGTRWEYSVATDVLGRVVELVSGKLLDAVFRDEIFAPLGMLDTWFSVPSRLVGRFATLYTAYRTPRSATGAEGGPKRRRPAALCRGGQQTHAFAIR